MEDDYAIIEREARHEETSGWQRWNRRLLFIIFLCLGIISWRLYIPELKRNQEIDAELTGLKAQLEREQKTNAELTSEYNWLNNPDDTTYLESYARDKLNLGRPGETLIRMESADPRRIMEERQLPVVTAPPRPE